MKITYTVPQNIKGRKIVIGDIHGCFYTLQALLESTICITSEDQLFLLGDYIDRGFHSHKVLDYLMSLSNQGFQIHPLRGNHEQMFLEAYRCGEEFFQKYLKHYHSEGLASSQTQLTKYLAFCDKLPYYFDIDGYYLAHAGINFKAKNPFQDQRRMLFNMRVKENRNFLSPEKKLIHGHFPKPLEEIQESIHKKSLLINLDGGCVYPSLGYLCALELDTDMLYVQRNQE